MPTRERLDPESIHDATELTVRDLGLEAAERDLQQRLLSSEPGSIERARAFNALGALRRGEVQR